MPDIFVPFDTSTLAPAVASLYLSRTLNSFLYRYFIQHKEEFKSYRNATDFAKKFEQEEALWKDLVPFAAKDSIDLSVLSDADKKVTQRRIKALLAKQPWRNEGFYEVLNLTDPVVKKALEELSK